MQTTVASLNISTGNIDEFAIPSFVSDPFGNPAGIVAGSDGNLWFTERATSLIGRITTLGVITEFSTPTKIARPNLIAAGPDGNLWFAESFKPGIGRINPKDLTFEEYPLVNPSFPRAVDCFSGWHRVGHGRSKGRCR